MSEYAGAAGAFLTISSDRSAGHSLLYSTADAGVQWGAGFAAGGSAAAACAEGGPVAIGCGVAGFLVGLLAAHVAGAAFSYSFDNR